MGQLIFLLFLGLSHLQVHQCLRFHSYFADDMVLQHNAPNKIWGFDALDEVHASMSCNAKNGIEMSEKVSGVVSADGIWTIELPPKSSIYVCNIEVSAAGEVTSIDGVLFGDVWICSGQSNMEQTMQNIMNSTEEIKNSAKYNTIRYMVVANTNAADVDDNADIDVQVLWSNPAGNNLHSMSAVCFLFARNIQDMMASEGQDPIPMGMVDSDWGGTRVEAWSSTETLDECNVDQSQCNEQSPQNCPSRLWNAMINPLKRTTVKGFLWYQGEANSGYNRDLYNCTFPAMIKSWRREFSTHSATAEDAPFGFVQLASWRPDELAAGFPVIRWHQTADVGYVPNDVLKNVFMSTPLDTYDSKEGYPGGIHPRYKQIVAERLAVAGMNVAYGFSSPYAPYGPFPSFTKFKAETFSLEITYEEAFTYNNKEISGFYVCKDTVENCDAGNSVSSWEELNKDSVAVLDDTNLSINLDAFKEEDTLSIAYIWRETPVKEYLGLPIYGVEPFYLPSPPWKMTVVQ